MRLLCVDVDGVLTDAGMYYGPDGEVLKKFNTRDGLGLAFRSAAAVMIMLIAGQVLGGMILSHYGWLGSPVQHITLMNIVGAAVMIGGVVLATWAR